MPQTVQSSKNSDLIILAFLFALIVILHNDALSGSWRWDDGMHLLHATQYSWHSVFLDPQVLRSASGNQFAPWNLLIYQINGTLFGGDTQLYYLHHLVSLFLCTAGVYALLRQWLPPRDAWIAPMLLLIGVPTFQMARQLMVGHYLYGLLFATLGLVFFIRSVRHEHLGKAMFLGIASAASYGMACLSKEIYVPWILLWLAIPWVLNLTWRKWMPLVMPTLLVALAYTIARVNLFGGAEGYYGGGMRRWETISIIQGLADVPVALFGGGIKGVACTSLTVLALIVGIRKSPSLLMIYGAALLIILVPLVFLASSNPPWLLHARYLWAPWLLVCLAWAVPWRGHPKQAKWLACICFLTLVALQVASARPADQQLEQMFDAHSRMILQHEGKVKFWAPTEFNSAGYVTFVAYAAHEAMRRRGLTATAPPKLMRQFPEDTTDQIATQIWHASCNCFRSFHTLTTDERDAALTRMRSEKGMLLPGVHPLADAFHGPTPEMRIDGNRLHISGAVASEGAGHVLLLAGWAPSRLIASNISVSRSIDSIDKIMKFSLSLESEDEAAAIRTSQQICVLMQSQTHPYRFVALDSSAPTSACRQLLTPWALGRR